MTLLEKTQQAFRRAIDQADNLSRLAEKTGVDYATVNRLNSGRRGFENLTVQNFFKLFPEMTIYFFRDELPHVSSQSMGDVCNNTGPVVNGNNYGGVANRNTVIHGDNHGDITVGLRGGAEAPTAAHLRDLLVDCEDVSAETKIKILKLLKEDRP